MYAGSVDNSSILNSVAQEVANECKGLPVAIVAVGISLGGKILDEWKIALKRLRESKPIDIEEEDYEIGVEDLVRHGKGIWGDVDSLEETRSQVLVAINNLIDSSLLLCVDETKCVRMHDLVRDVVLWVASKEDHRAMVNPQKDLKALSEDETTRDCTAISLWNQNIDKLPDRLECPPKLETFLLSNMLLLELPDLFFEGMQELKVLDLRKTASRWTLLLPQSIQLLTNLRCLRLRGWDLDDISILTSLKRLEILELCFCSLNELPNGIIKLDKLKLLDLSVPKPLKSFPKMCWSLSQDCKGYSISRSLYVTSFDTSTPNTSSIKKLIQRAENLCLRKLQSCKNIIPNMDTQLKGMNDLIVLMLDSCSEMECLIDTTSTTVSSFQVAAVYAFSNLVILRLSHMHDFVELYHGPTPQCFLEKLEEIHLSYCPGLSSILFPRKLNLCSLKVMEVEYCEQLTSLFPLSVARTLVQLEKLKNKIEIVFPALERLILQFLPNCESICPENYHAEWPSLQKSATYVDMHISSKNGQQEPDLKTRQCTSSHGIQMSLGSALVFK
ncbi:Disease resistance protein [Quillaja saponaria]|uniref:Disease resistance protein n=1 Tax=Quillaja saponaria TaxID=32244 RepID=A0AAD7PCC4_QUISA|nr:Disease resistance protein [Quillaja saponaria]